MLLPSGSLRHVVLSQLWWSPMHGYALRQTAGEVGWIYPVNNSAVYPVLHDLEIEGLVTHSTEIHCGRVRKVYTITEAGRAELVHWLASAPENELSIFDSAAFKVAAYRPETIGHAKSWMEGTIHKLRVHIDDRAQQLESDGGQSEFARLAGEYGVDMLRLRVSLLERVLALADGGESVATQGRLEVG